MLIKNYPDGSAYADIKHLNSNEFTYRINTYEDLWNLGQIIEAINYNGIKPTVTIPNLIDAQADRRFDKSQSFGLKMVANFLNSFDVEKYKIFHPHNPEVVEALVNRVEIIDNSQYIKLVLSLMDTDNLILMSSDAGGFKPLMKLCEKINWCGETFSASKSRSWDENDGTKFIQQINRDDFNKKDILIIDDICVYGGTFKGIYNLLKDKNVGNIYLAVSHMTVQNLGQNPITDYFKSIYTTNSKFDEYYGRDDFKPKNLKVINLF